MVKIKDVLDAVEELVQGRFPSFTAYRNRVREGFERPSFLTACLKQTMEDATARTVERTAQVTVTLFEMVDDYHDSQIEVLSEDLAAALELFSCRAVAVGDRYLDVGEAKGEVGYDYAELTFSLSWQDDRELNEPEYEPIRHVDVTMEANKNQ